MGLKNGIQLGCRFFVQGFSLGHLNPDTYSIKINKTKKYLQKI